jgi:hypothetical protein
MNHDVSRMDLMCRSQPLDSIPPRKLLMEGDFSSQAVSKDHTLYTPNPPPAQICPNTNDYFPNVESLTGLDLPAHCNSTQNLIKA